MDKNPLLSNEPNEQIDQLLREAKAAIKLGDKVSARKRLKEIIGMDQFNEQAWYWLAAVGENDAERMEALNNVIMINPNNTRAHTLIEQLQGNPNAGLALGEDVKSGSGIGLNSGTFTFESVKAAAPAAIQKLPKNVLLIAGGGIAALVVLLIIVGALAGRGTATPVLPTLLPTLSNGDSTQAVAQAATAGATADAALPAGSDGRPTLPPTWTPEPSPTSSSGAVGTPLPKPPVAITGRLVGTSGTIPVSGNFPIVIIDIATGNVTPISDPDVGSDAVFTPDGQRVLYSRYLSGSNSVQLSLVGADGGAGVEFSGLWGNQPPLTNVLSASFAKTAPVVVLSAASLAQNDGTPDIWIVVADNQDELFNGKFERRIRPTLTQPPPPTLDPAATREAVTATQAVPTGTFVAPTPSPAGLIRRLTDKDSGTNLWPNINADGTQVVFVRQPTGTSVDLYVMNIKSGKITPLTSDLDANTEASPEFSPDGTKIVFQSTPKGKKQSDLYIMDADGQNVEALTEGGNNIRPHWSPDGKYLAFSSQRGGKWEIYVMDVATKDTYQVTQTKGQTICTGWSPVQ